jgi:PAS domain S-box-containing protein
LKKLDNKDTPKLNHSLVTDLTLMKKALDASSSGIILTDHLQPDNPIIYCNHAFEEMTGYNRNEVIGHNCRFLQGKDRNQEARLKLKEAIAEGRDCRVEIRNYKKNGDLFWNELYLSAIRNSKNEVTHFIGVQNNISRRKKAEIDLLYQQQIMEKQIIERTRLLRESEEYLASIVQTVRESLIVLDKDINVLSANEYFLKTFKVSEIETKGKKLYDLGNGQWDIANLKEMLENILPTNNPVEDFKVEHDFPHIGKKTMLLNAYRIELEGNYKDRILIAIEDITERREIERRKDDFLSIASHELKTPLTTIKGYMQMMTRTIPENSSDKFRNIVSKTELYVERLNNLITELLDVTKIQSGNIELHKELFDFDKMVVETIEGMRMANENYEIKLEGFTNAMFNGDESHIVQVLNNLLSNAIKYSPNANHVLVYLSTVSNYIKVSVIDYGMGISDDDQKKIFERFYRVGDIQQKFPGMGIGLYICDQIIKNHGGTLWVESEKNRGSNFSFTLPINERETNDI